MSESQRLTPPPSAAPQRALGPSFGARVLEQASSYLPLLLMALLALGTWWLVKNTPLAEAPRSAAPLRHEPDYLMSQFMVRRFAADGAMRAQIEGDMMRHYPDTDTLEIDNVRLRAVAPDGHVTLANARRALSNGDGSEWQLSGGAHVVAQMRSGPPLELDSEFLHVIVPTERIRSHLPVIVRQGNDEIRAGGGIDADNLAQQMQLAPPVRASFPSPRAPQRPTTPRAAP